jgi:hypothetical protein
MAWKAPASVNVPPSVHQFRGHQFTMMPGWGAWWTGENEGDLVGMDEVKQPHGGDDGAIPWLEGGDATVINAGGAATFSTYHELGSDPTPFEMAVALATGQLEAVFHEVVEWTTVDGERIADPHPGLETNWGWVQERLRAMVQDYAAKFPVRPQAEA